MRIMTERKPPNMSFDTWIDKQIREATERGAFDDLPGAGKPIPGAGEGYDEGWWLRQFLRRENVTSLPPTLALRKEVQDAVAAVPGAPTEAAARALVERMNEKIAAAIRVPPAGPPLNLLPLDVDALLATWHEAHPAAAAPAEPPADQPAGPPPRRRWLRRRA
jgi:hypothetical protein